MNSYYQSYLQYKFGNQKGGKKYACGKWSQDEMPGEPPCHNGTIDHKKFTINGKGYHGWDFPSFLKCAYTKKFIKKKKSFEITSGTVVVGDVYRHPIQTGKDIKNMKKGSYHVYIYQYDIKIRGKIYPERTLCVTLHSDYSKKDIKELNWICYDTFNTDIGNGGLYDKKYYGKPSEISSISGDPGWDCTEKKNQWSDCKRMTIVSYDHVLPHGFFIGTSGDGGFRYWIAKNKSGKVIGVGFAL